MKQSIQRDGWENVYFEYMCGYKSFVLVEFNKSILMGLNGNMHVCVCVSLLSSFSG